MDNNERIRTGREGMEESIVDPGSIDQSSALVQLQNSQNQIQNSPKNSSSSYDLSDSQISESDESTLFHEKA